jgi:hypothetical protein
MDVCTRVYSATRQLNPFPLFVVLTSTLVLVTLTYNTACERRHCRRTVCLITFLLLAAVACLQCPGAFSRRAW